MVTKEKEKERARRRKEEKEEEEEEKSNGFTLSLYNSYFWPKKLFDTKGPFGDNVIKKPARCIINLLKVQFLKPIK